MTFKNKIMAGKTKAVRAYDLEGNFLEDFQSISDAANELKVSISNISRAAVGQITSVESYQFRELNELTLDHIPAAWDYANGYNYMPIAKYWNGRLVAVYNSQREAATKNNLTQGNIATAIANGYKLKGFKFLPITP